MAWIYLTVAGLFEIGWAIGLKYTDGFTRLLPSLWTLASMILSIVLLGLALRIAAGRDRLRGMDRDRRGRDRRARHLSVRGAGNRGAAVVHRTDPVRYCRPQAGDLNRAQGRRADRASLIPTAKKTRSSVDVYARAATCSSRRYDIDHRTATGATVDPVPPSIFNGCTMSANSDTPFAANSSSLRFSSR